MFGMFFFLTQFLQDVLGYSNLETGFAFLPLTVAVFAMSQLSAAVLVGRFGAAPGDDRRHHACRRSGMLGLTQLSETSSYLVAAACR